MQQPIINEERIILFENYIGFLWQYKDNPEAYTFYDFEENKEKNFYLNPIYLFNPFNIEVKNLNIKNNETELTLLYEYNYKENIVYDKGIYYYNDYLPTDLTTEIYYKNNLIYEKYFYSKNFENYLDEEEVLIALPINILEEDLVLKIKNYTSLGAYEEEFLSFEDLNQSVININFKNSLVQNIFLPTSYNNSKVEGEEITFLKPFKNNLDYPKNIKVLLIMKYDQNKNKNNLILNDISEGQIYLNGLSNEYLSFKVNCLKKDDYFIFYVDDLFNYDLEENITSKGSKKYSYEKNSIILPWDYENNNGYITFSFKTTSFIQREFNIYLPININNSLRNGNNSKYSFKESNQYDFNKENFECVSFLIPFSDFNSEVNFDDLKNWIIYD
ncbi:MAG: hypothetical protein HPAVJP_4720 [Candidatus Hepatoplasma vulgare]|nr:MAG: hypothetical protein HPAVJP_4720 [Candidatus Hepatoplasma sp.]